MRITYITAGAGGMYCGNCLRDNTLATALGAKGHEVVLVPLYTPIRTDEHDVSLRRVFYGGLNVYLQQSFSWFRHSRELMDRVLDAPGLLRLVSRFGIRTDPRHLGELTLSVLKGDEGYQQKELRKLLSWMDQNGRPQVVHLTNSLLAGLAREIKQHLHIPVVCGLQGEDVFLEGLPEPYCEQAQESLRKRIAYIDAFVAPSHTYADFMAELLKIPRERIHVVNPGLNLTGHGRPKKRSPEKFIIGYMARVSPDKGLHILVEAFRILRQTTTSADGLPRYRLRVGGYLSPQDRPYLDRLKRQLQREQLADDFEYLGTMDREAKINFLQGLNVLSVPTTYAAPKCLYMLEAWANGVPVVEPRHGSFPEFIEASGGGFLFEPNCPEDLAAHLRRIAEDPVLAETMGEKGRTAVHKQFNVEKMTEETLAIYRRYVS